MAQRAGRMVIGIAVVLTLVVNAAVVVARTGTEPATSIEAGSAKSASLGANPFDDASTSTTAPLVPVPPGPVVPPGQWSPTTTTRKPPPTTTSTTRGPTTTVTTVPAPVAGVEGPGLHVIKPDGTGLLRLTGHNGGLFTWSPDGTRLAHSTGAELIIVRADGSGRTTLPAAHGALVPVWSPDGTMIAFGLGAGGVFVARTDGSGTARLIDPDGYLVNWTPDNRLAVLTFAVVGGFSSVVLYDLAGGRRVLTTAADSSVDPAPSPDGRLVAYVKDGVMVAAMDGSGSRSLTGACCASDGFSWRQRWSPDSRQLAYQHFGDVWVAQSDGSGKRLLAEKAVSPAWSPDGRSVALTDARATRADGLIHSKLALIPAEGGERRTIYDPGQVLGVGLPQWSPTGRQIAVIVTQNSLPPLPPGWTPPA